MTPNRRTRFAAAVGLLTSGTESRTMGRPAVVTTGLLGCCTIIMLCGGGGGGMGMGMDARGGMPAEPKKRSCLAGAAALMLRKSRPWRKRWCS